MRKLHHWPTCSCGKALLNFKNSNPPAASQRCAATLPSYSRRVLTYEVENNKDSNRAATARQRLADLFEKSTSTGTGTKSRMK